MIVHRSGDEPVRSPYTAEPMPLLVRNIRLSLEDSEDRLRSLLAKRLNVPEHAIRGMAIIRRSLDARRKDDIHFSYQIEADLDEPDTTLRARVKRMRPGSVAWIEPAAPIAPSPGDTSLKSRPVVVGFGPGGMFAALRLAQYGYAPIVLERGRDVRRRHRDVLQRFYQQGRFEPSSNLLFGEGGAGTYSDGKLYTRMHDPLCRQVLETLHEHGADADILVDTRPHIGSDRLPTICKRIRKKIESMGGEIRFECQIDDLDIQDDTLSRLHIIGAGTDGEWIETGSTILAVGHSARDTLTMIHNRGVKLVPKPFQLGVRIEHPQAMVDRWQYGAAAGHRLLGPAEYHVVVKKTGDAEGDMFSFCMCPGGEILPTNESPGLIATNGASRASRSSPFANSGLVISLDPAAILPTKGAQLALDAMAFLRQWEQRAFEATGGTYAVPVQRASDFLQRRSSTGCLETSYPLGGCWTNIADLIPSSVESALRKALPMLQQKFPGFAGEEALIAAPETRASSPVRILRDSVSRQAVNIANLYPVGEGAGYAGGIISAAVDGIKSADMIIHRFAPIR